jgi:phosphate starvation-inducible PhoH-like protein
MEPIQEILELDDNDVVAQLAGPGGRNLQLLGRELELELHARGNRLTLVGGAEAVQRGAGLLRELYTLAENGRQLDERELKRAARALREPPKTLAGNGGQSAAGRRVSAVFGDKVVTPQLTIRPKGAAQKDYLDAIRAHDIVFGVGPAGTGKTYLAMAKAVAALLGHEVKRIILTRPAVEAGERLGFLPGDLVEKVNPYLRPLYDALHDMLDIDRTQQLLERGLIEVAPLAFMRGRTLNGSFVILDEAQNTTSEQMMMFLTRLGFDSQAVITGDVTQTDLPSGSRSGLVEAIDLLADVEDISICRFSKRDVVRHPLVERIIVAYERGRARRDAPDAADRAEPTEAPVTADEGASTGEGQP